MGLWDSLTHSIKIDARKYHAAKSVPENYAI